MSAKHTPGWVVADGPYAFTFMVKAEDGSPVADISDVPGAKAYAKLIAAAPDLADALELALDIDTCECPPPNLEIGGLGHDADCWTAIARAALRKAGRLPQ